MRFARADLRAYPGRFAAALLALTIGVGFVVATLVFTASFRTDLTRSIGAEQELVDVMVAPRTAGVTADDRRITTVAGVASAEPRYSVAVSIVPGSGTGRGWGTVTGIPVDPAHRWFTLTEGSLPAAADQILTDTRTATRTGLAVGSRLTMTGDDGTSRPVGVSGLVAVHTSPLVGSPDRYFAPPELVSSLAAGRVDRIAVTAAPGSAAPDVAAALARSLGGAASVRTGAQAAEDLVPIVLGRVDLLDAVLFTFAAIAGLVAASVIANTFMILLTQRTRQLGLLRCVGASRRQLWRWLMAEAGLVGTIGAALGVAAGVGVATVTLAATGMRVSSLTIDPAVLALSAAGGVTATALCALAPAARAMRISPLAALDPLPSAAEGRRASRWRILCGGLLTAVGGGLLAGGVVLPSLVVAVGGGLVSATGILLLLRSVLPAIVRMLDTPARLVGVPGRLGVANARRHPGRSAATSTALVVAVGLIVTLQVATASARAGLAAALAQRYPLDIGVVADADPAADTGSGVASGAAGEPGLPTGLLDLVNRIEGVRAVEVPGTTAEVRGPQDTLVLTVLGATAASTGLLRAPIPADGTVALPRWVSDSLQLQTGDPVLLARSGQTDPLTLTLAAGRIADAQGSVAVISAEDLRRLDPAAPLRAIWGSMADLDAADVTIRDLTPLLAPYSGLTLSGAAADHAAVAEGLRAVVRLITALLAVAAAIAVVGIGNTLGLSMVERTREVALLRALGLHRRQLRHAIAAEAAVLAGVGAVVGIVLGIGYGWLGAAATFAQAQRPLVLALPVGQIAVDLVLAVLAGSCAALLPARRAIRADSTAALLAT